MLQVLKLARMVGSCPTCRVQQLACQSSTVPQHNVPVCMYVGQRILIPTQLAWAVESSGRCTSAHVIMQALCMFSWALLPFM